ncbi:MAG TPA: signal peptide peptidase SppA, partial [Roseiflexaceae bacterium]|nr:signal peptide peptidase SppA [Roseiflexaceae bacterium]
MIGSIIVLVLNLCRSLANGWRRLLRRRVDYVRIELGGTLPEFTTTPAWWRRRLLGAREPASLHGLRRMLQRIAADPQASGVLLKIDGLAAGWATLQSLRAELAHFRASGKRAVAYLQTPDMAGYYAACAADEVLVPPSAFLMITGLR